MSTMRVGRQEWPLRRHGREAVGRLQLFAPSGTREAAREVVKEAPSRNAVSA